MDAKYQITSRGAEGGGASREAMIALLMLVPAPTIGTWMSMYGAPGVVGGTVYFISKVWLLALPLVWRLRVQREGLSWSPLKEKRGLWVGAGLGLAISAVILGGYWFVARNWVDAETMRKTASESGFGTKGMYLLLAVYLIAVNSLLEEYVWRWFVYRQCERLMAKAVAVAASAVFFTLHHILVLNAQFDWRVTAAGSVGVFMGGATWSWCYGRYRSIWPGFLSHAIVDVAILVIGWRILFGGA